MSSIAFDTVLAASGVLFLVAAGLVTVWLARLDKTHPWPRPRESPRIRNKRKVQDSWKRLLRLEKGESESSKQGPKAPGRHKLDLAAFWLLFIDTLIAFTGLVFAFTAA
jgi:hypothetical protein